MAAAPTAAAAAAEPVEEKTEFNVVIKDAGAKKIEVIKVIRQLTPLGLKEAKELAETAGSKVLESVSKESAMDAKAKLEAAGAVIEVQ
jgi:large subunit ribosomal protein L7/L12